MYCPSTRGICALLLYFQVASLAGCGVEWHEGSGLAWQAQAGSKTGQ